MSHLPGKFSGWPVVVVFVFCACFASVRFVLSWLWLQNPVPGGILLQFSRGDLMSFVMAEYLRRLSPGGGRLCDGYL